MKKILCVLSILALLICLTACNTDNGVISDGNNSGGVMSSLGSDIGNTASSVGSDINSAFNGTDTNNASSEMQSNNSVTSSADTTDSANISNP